MATESPPSSSSPPGPAAGSADSAGALACVHLLIHGHVQGVFFRSSAAHEARVRGVRGWVRNLPSGSVELWAEGAPEAVSALVAWCQHGPPAARVERVESRPGTPTGTQDDFEVRRGG